MMRETVFRQDCFCCQFVNNEFTVSDAVCIAFCNFAFLNLFPHEVDSVPALQILNENAFSLEEKSGMLSADTAVFRGDSPCAVGTASDDNVIRYFCRRYFMDKLSIQLKADVVIFFEHYFQSFRLIRS